MTIREVLLAALLERFGDRGPRIGAPPDPIAVFPAKHAEVGDVRVASTAIEWDFTTIVSIGDIIDTELTNFDSHLERLDRAARLTQDVSRFLEELFADRLLFWRSTDGRNAGWRERGRTEALEPLVLDNRTYRTYLWSGPLAVWQAVPAIFARGRIRDDREYEIMSALLQDVRSDRLNARERDVATRLVGVYVRERAV